MEFLLVLLFLGLVFAGVVVFLRSRQPAGMPGAPAGLGAATPAPPPEGDIRALKPGDVVAYDGGDFVVEGTLRFNQDGYTWQEHRLVDGTNSVWISVEDDEGLEVVVWIRGSTRGLEPEADEITHEGVTYALDERGEADFTAEGSTGTAASGRVVYADYEAGEQRLSFERFGGDAGWEVGVGTVISEHSLDVYPGRGLAP